MSNITSGAMALLEKGLDAAWLKQKVISANIANAQTPGYKSRSVEFEKIFTEIIKSSDSPKDLIASLKNVEPEVTVNESLSVSEDGNNVVLDAENIEMARAQIQYDYLVKALSSQISRLKYAINEGKGV